jgi:SAM-dependent methyltransferase
MLPHLETLGRDGESGVLRILDVGCGSGRLARWLDRRLQRPQHSIGLDRSLPILRLAAADAPAHTSWTHADLVATDGRLPYRDGAVDAAVAVGLLHHLPSFALRRGLIADLSRLLRSGGLLVLAFWQFGADPRFERRVVGWERAPAVDRSELEPGDRLLRWGDGDGSGASADGSLRYCHYADAAEAERLTTNLPLEIVDSFVADGRSAALNLYRILRRT